MKRLPLILVVLFIAAGCTAQKRDTSDRVWTEAELNALQGKTREEIQEILGPPKGLYTYDSKDRWHYSSISLSDQDPGAIEIVSVLVYFSKLGEHRATIIEIRRHTEE
jgi:hypothetical protein